MTHQLWFGKPGQAGWEFASRHQSKAAAVVLAFVVLLDIAAPQSSADDAECAGARTAETAILRCSDAISSGGLSNEALAYAHARRGGAYYERGETDRALGDLDRAIALKGNFTEAFINRGILHRVKGENDRALHDFDEAIRLRPDDPEVFLQRGLVYRARGEIDRAIDDFSQAIRLKSDYPEALGNRGHAYWSKEQFDRSIGDYNQALQLKPDLTEVLYGRANAYRSRGESDRALKDYERVVQLDPGHYRAYYWQGYIHLLRGDSSRSIIAFRQGVQASSRDPWTALWLYVAQSRAGEDGRQELAANTSQFDHARWPAPLIELFLGKRSVESVFSSASDARRLCHSYFFAGEFELLRQRFSAARQMFTNAVRVCARNGAESVAARSGLDRLTIP
ncbi:MAG TPA: tetratricopeptide repeat protein [Methylomirabilota bacterium]|nr:tetratricopeptide repeat protein [Methylomirabilota bacterium]